jgi:hypothetical protein
MTSVMVAEISMRRLILSSGILKGEFEAARNREGWGGLKRKRR